MVRIQIDKTKLEDDDDQTAAAAYAAGWRIEQDDWWVRAIRDGDPDKAPDGFIAQRHVYMSDAATAIAFDAR